MSTYRPAPEVERIGNRLIAKHHTHLHGTRVEWVFRDEASRSGGRMVWGKARKKSGLDALLANPGVEDSDDQDFFVIEVALDVWGLLSKPQQVALVDHELSHCRCEENEGGELRLLIAGHDVEEFGDVLARHGLWKPDLSLFMAKIGPTQLELFAEGARHPDDAESESEGATVLRMLPAVDHETGEILDEEEADDGEDIDEAAATDIEDDDF